MKITSIVFILFVIFILTISEFVENDFKISPNNKITSDSEYIVQDLEYPSSDKIISLEDDVIENTRKKPLIIHRRLKFLPNNTFILRNIKDENSINSKGVLLDLFINEADLTTTQVRTLMLMMFVGIITFILLLSIFCLFRTFFKKDNKKCMNYFDSAKSIEFHKGGGGI
ncbi:hypothetical protein MXB_3297 [Myxobolus squamalis]|nr:hypothetical protein MXB_3297 [Myxobolus squamalis]